MPNNNATTAASIIAQEALPLLKETLPLFGTIVTDLSDESVRFGQSVIARLISPTAAQEFDSEYGYVPSEQSAQDVPVTLNRHAHATFAFTDVERSKSVANLVADYSGAVAHALAKKLGDDLYALIGSGAFTNITTLSGNFDRSTVVDIGTALSKRNVPVAGRFMHVNSDLYNPLLKDLSVFAAYLNPAGKDVVSTGSLPNINGFAITEVPWLPAGSNKLAGFAAAKSALCMVARVPETPDFTGDTTITNVTDAATGLTIQVRDRYDGRMGRQEVSYTIMYGFAAGQKSALQKVVTA